MPVCYPMRYRYDNLTDVKVTKNKLIAMNYILYYCFLVVIYYSLSLSVSFCVFVGLLQLERHFCCIVQPYILSAIMIKWRITRYDNDKELTSVYCTGVKVEHVVI